MCLFMLMVVKMGRWSDASACIVFQVVRLCRSAEIVVMSGEVGWCAWLVGKRVGVLVLSAMWFELRRRSSISSPL